MRELKDRPFLYLFIAIVTSALTVVGGMTLATTNYVDNQDKKVKEFIRSSHDDVKQNLKDIKTNIRENHKLILDILRQSK